ncbi:nitrite reductase (NAD(P)H) small subunit, partial [Acinetobacter baumannii]
MNIVQDKNMLPDDQWIDVCALDDLTPNTGAGALVGGQAVAIFRVGHEKRVYV